MTSRAVRAIAALGAASVCACAGAAVAQPCQTGAAPAPPAQDAAVQAISAEAERIGRSPGPYPTFCAIPPMPTDLRTEEEWRVAVAEVQGAGSSLGVQAQELRDLPVDTDQWAGAALEEAAPPPPITTPSDTDDFARQMRERATPPPRPR